MNDIKMNLFHYLKRVIVKTKIFWQKKIINIIIFLYVIIRINN